MLKKSYDIICKFQKLKMADGHHFEFIRAQYLNKYLSQTDRTSAAHTIRRGYLCDLKIYVKGHSRSLETEPLDRSYTTYY